MSKSLNISVLVAARDEYIDQLKSILVPLITQGFNSIYQDAITISNNQKVIYKFQELLKQIPQWNQTILQEESKRIKKKCPYIMDIVTAIFVTNVKILASVRLKGSKEDIRVKIPTSDIFIHSIYIESAQQIFYDPFLFYHKDTKNYGKVQENKQHIKQIISYAVDETIRQMLPFDDILQKYLADALKDNAEFGNGSSESEESYSDSDEQSISDGDFPSDEESEEEEPEDAPDKNFVLGGAEQPSKPFMFSKDPEDLEKNEDPDEGSESDPETIDEHPRTTSNTFLPSSTFIPPSNFAPPTTIQPVQPSVHIHQPVPIHQSTMPPQVQQSVPVQQQSVPIQQQVQQSVEQPSQAPFSFFT
jgi:hypothetical protein